MSTPSRLPTLSASNDYPGRIVVVGALWSGRPFWLYAVTGRSPSSLARTAELADDGTVTISPTEGSADDDLRHYVAARPIGDGWIVGNGAQVEGVGAVGLADLPDAFEAWEHEPDPPIWTPRIIAAVAPSPTCRIAVGGARRTPDGSADHLWLTGSPAAGTGVRIQTYGGPVEEPHPDAVPRWVRTPADVEAAATEVWDALAPERRVLVVARDLVTGSVVLRQR